VAAIPALLAGLYGAEAGALVPYVLAAGAIAVCFFYPTLFGWWVIFVIYCVASALYVYALVRDLLRLGTGQTPSVLLDQSDTAVFIVWVGLLVTVTLLLWMIRPWWKAPTDR
jgi:hypothetical protein